MHSNDAAILVIVLVFILLFFILLFASVLVRGDTFIEVRVQAVRLKLCPLAAARLTLAL